VSRRVAILGCGKIGESLLGGLLSAKWREPKEVVATSRRDERAGELRGHYGIEATSPRIGRAPAASSDINRVYVVIEPLPTPPLPVSRTPRG